MSASGPLSGVRVIEVSSYIAAPLGGMTLAQLGADVVRIDPIGGAPDVGRWPLADSGASLYWAGLNKGKQSIMVDLRSHAGREVVRKLIATCPQATAVVLTNAVGHEWLSYQALREVAPDVIHVQVEGTPGGGAAIDYTVNAAAGFPLVTGTAGVDGPVNHVLPAWDIACGLYAALGVVAAVRHRDKTGAGQSISVALSDVALSMAGHLGFLAEAQVNNVQRQRIGNYLYGSFGRDFACSDGTVMVVALTKRHWEGLVARTNCRDQIDQLSQLLGVDFTDESERYRHRESICTLLEPWFAARSVATVGSELGSSVVWAPYRTFSEVVRSLEAGLEPTSVFGWIDQPGVGRYLAPGSALAMSGAHPAVVPAPELGQHTTTVLTEWLGANAATVTALLNEGVVAQPWRKS